MEEPKMPKRLKKEELQALPKEERKAYSKAVGEWYRWRKNHIDDDEECKMQGNVGQKKGFRPY